MIILFSGGRIFIKINVLAGPISFLKHLSFIAAAGSESLSIYSNLNQGLESIFYFSFSIPIRFFGVF